MSEAPKPLDAALDLFVYVPVGLAMTAAEELPKLAAKGRTRVNNQLAMARVVGQFAVARGRQLVESRLANPVPAPPAPAPGPAAARPTHPVEGQAVTFDEMTGQGSGPGSDTGEEPRLAAITPIDAARTGGGPAVASGSAADVAADEVLPGADTVDAEGGVTVSTVGDLGSADAASSESAASGSAISESASSGSGLSGSGPAEPAPDRGTLAIPGYDSLSASQVVQRLAGLNQEELAAVGAYEQAHRGRRTVLNRVDQLRGA